MKEELCLKNKKIGFGITGSHCTYQEIIPIIEQLMSSGCEVIPFITDAVRDTSTRFGEAGIWEQKIAELTKKTVIDSVVAAEPFGSATPLDCMVIAPITGSSLSKMACAQYDSAVLMAAKATLRNLAPVVLAVSTNDGLGLNGSNIMKLMATKNIYFVPFGQDDHVKKPNSLVAQMKYVPETIIKALQNKQLQPVLVSY